MEYISSWRSPSNIALIKYWGKHGIQLPRNPSLSFTLSACHTDMTVKVLPDAGKQDITVLYDGHEATHFLPKIKSFFDRLHTTLPWLKQSLLVIDSINTFPHGAGIASSASAMSALALCLAEIDVRLNGKSFEASAEWKQRVSTIARLGSGSAARSVFPECAVWGKSNVAHESSDEYAIEWSHNISNVFKTYQDTILIVSAGEKSVSSTAGHDLMNSLPYAQKRYEVANTNFDSIVEALQQEQVTDSFINICESEALQLHAMMMSGPQPFILMQPDTLAIIQEIWKFRKESSIPVCFTLDAGPNVHMLYPVENKHDVVSWMQESLIPFCADGIFIMDEVGRGPVKLIAS